MRKEAIVSVVFIVSLLLLLGYMATSQYVSSDTNVIVSVNELQRNRVMLSPTGRVQSVNSDPIIRGLPADPVWGTDKQAFVLESGRILYKRAKHASFRHIKRSVSTFTFPFNATTLDRQEIELRERLWARIMNHSLPEGKREILSWMWRGDFEFYWDMARALPDGAQIVEVGTFHGGAVIVLASALKLFGKNNCNITCYDIWPGWEPGYPRGARNTFGIFETNMKKFKIDDMVTGVQIPRDRSDTATIHGVANQSLDFVYIDDGHGYNDVTHDLETWARTVKPGGILSGHDYDPRFHSDVVRAAHAYCKRNNASLMRYSQFRSEHNFYLSSNSIVYLIDLDHSGYKMLRDSPPIALSYVADEYSEDQP